VKIVICCKTVFPKFTEPIVKSYSFVSDSASGM